MFIASVRQIVLSDMPPLLEGIVFEAVTLTKSLDSLRDWWMSTKTDLDVIADGITSELPINRHKSAPKEWVQLEESFRQYHDQVCCSICDKYIDNSSPSYRLVYWCIIFLCLKTLTSP